VRGMIRLLVMCGLLSGASACVRAEDGRPPNVVIILADDLGYADVGCFGAAGVRTPHIDRLAREGTRFTSFYVGQAVCTASRAALLTGCYPNRIGMSGALNHTSTTGIHPDEPLLSELLTGRGYATAAFGKWHLGMQEPFWPTQRGFAEFLGIPYSNDNGPLHPTVRGMPPLPFYDGEHIVETDPDQSQFTRRFTERAVRFIAACREKPFFLYVPHVMPHVPIFASADWQGTSGRGLYGDVVQELDWSVGRILTALQEQGLAERTLVVFTSDNGPFLSYGDHAGAARPLREGKLTTFEGGMRVPCVVRWPGRVPAGRTCDEVVSTMDLFATIAGLAGVALPPRQIDGVDLGPLFVGAKGAGGRNTFWFYSGDELHAVRSGRWKLHLPHEYLTVKGPAGQGGSPAHVADMSPQSITESGIRGIASRHGYAVASQPQALYDLAGDPGESRDVSSEHPDIVAALESVAAAARAELGDAITEARGSGMRAAGGSQQPMVGTRSR